MVLVALDSPDGKPTAVPVWQPKDDEDRQLQSYARKLMDLSRSMEHEVVLLRGKAQHD
jgi:hypothetical protein